MVGKNLWPLTPWPLPWPPWWQPACRRGSATGTHSVFHPLHSCCASYWTWQLRWLWFHQPSTQTNEHNLTHITHYSCHLLRISMSAMNFTTSVANILPPCVCPVFGSMSHSYESLLHSFKLFFTALHLLRLPLYNGVSFLIKVNT